MRSERHAKARGSVLLEAVLAHDTGLPGVSYSRRREYYAHKDRYSGTAFAYSTVVPTIDALASQGLLENRIAAGSGPSGWQSSFRALPPLLVAVPNHLIADVRHAVPELVILRDGEKQPIPYRDTARTDRMRRALVAANDAIRSCRIGLDGQNLRHGGRAIEVDGVSLFPGMRTLYRVFNGDFSHGGRLYGPFWQQAPKSVRGRLLIDEEPVVERDHAQLHPRLLYALAGQKLVGDAYTLDGWDRRLCKLALNIVINAPNYRLALGALAKEMEGPDALARARLLIAEMKLKHGPISRYFHTGVGLLLQRIDADMAELVLIRLLKRGMVALPVHDSFIVRRSHDGQLAEAMDEAFLKAVRIA
jgi:hypothetical protein